MDMFKRNLTLMIVLTLGFGLTACESELDNKPAAKVIDTKKGEQPAKKADAKKADAKKDGAAKKGAESLAVDVAGGSLQIVGSHILPGGDKTMTFKKYEGKLNLKAGKAESIEFTVQMADFGSDVADAEKKTKFETHMTSKDFFDVKAFPTATFKSKKITEGDSAAGTHTIEGDLTLRGKTVTVKFPASITIDAKGAKGKAEFTINRKDFGIEYPGPAENAIKDEVLLKLNFSFPRK